MNDARDTSLFFRAMLTGRGEMGVRVVSFPWETTPLGSPQIWPQSLRSALDICFGLSSPAALFWGPDFVFLHNDAMGALLGKRHPSALGQRGSEVFAEDWTTAIEPILDRVVATEGAVAVDDNDQLLRLVRKGYVEGCYFDYTFNPVRRKDGSIAGIFVLAIETTDRVMAERALRASEARYRAFVHATSNSLYRTSADGAKLLEVFGSILPPHDANTKPSLTAIHDYVHPDDREMARATWTECVRNEASHEIELRGRRRDGTFGWMQSRAVPIRDEHGQVIEWMGSATDITERKRAEEALLRSEARLKAAIMLMGLALYSWDPATGALECDVRLRAIWGLPPEAHVDLDVLVSALHPDDRPRFEAAIAEATDPVGKGIYVADFRVIGINDGIERWVSTYGRTQFQEGRAVCFTGAVLDVTDRKHAEEHVRQSEAVLARILEQVPVGVGLYDTKGGLLLGNSVLRRCAGRVLPSSDAKLSQSWRGYGPDRQLLDVSEYPSQRALRGETTSPGMDFIHTYDDGHEMWRQVSAAPFHDETGKVTGAVVVIQDIDDEKRAQDANLVLIAELQHRTRNLLAVVRSISHQVLKGSISREDFSVRLNDRLGALSRVQGLLSRPPGTPVELGELLTMELDALGMGGNERVTMEGPHVALPFNVVQTLALALHELSTNALKYGALSSPEGVLHITWKLSQGERGERRLTLKWHEQGIAKKPQDAPPARRGYGRELIERAVPYQLRARTSLEIKDQEVSCIIDLPLADPGGG